MVCICTALRIQVAWGLLWYTSSVNYVITDTWGRRFWEFVVDPYSLRLEC